MPGAFPDCGPSTGSANTSTGMRDGARVCALRKQLGEGVRIRRRGVGAVTLRPWTRALASEQGAVEAHWIDFVRAILILFARHRRAPRHRL